MVAPLAIGLTAGLAGAGALGGAANAKAANKSKPQLPGELGFMLPQLRSLSNEAAYRTGGYLGSPLRGSYLDQLMGMSLDPRSGGTNIFDPAMQGFRSGAAGMQEGIGTGFLPDLAALDARFRPGMEDAFSRGAASIREQAALSGGLSDTSTLGSITDLRGQLERGLGERSASIYGNALPAAMNLRGQLSQAATDLPGNIYSQIMNPMAARQFAYQESNRDFPLDVLNTVYGAATGLPFAQRNKQSTLGGLMTGAVGGASAGLAGK